jgi:hypothetical protein
VRAQICCARIRFLNHGEGKRRATLLPAHATAQKFLTEQEMDGYRRARWFVAEGKLGIRPYRSHDSALASRVSRLIGSIAGFTSGLDRRPGVQSALLLRGPRLAWKASFSSPATTAPIKASTVGTPISRGEAVAEALDHDPALQQRRLRRRDLELLYDKEPYKLDRSRGTFLVFPSFMLHA